MIAKVGSIVMYVGYKGNGSRMHGIVLKVLPHDYFVWWYNGVTSSVTKEFAEVVEA